jgi:hypothetical protein
MTLLSRAKPTGLRFRLLALAPVVCGALALAPGANAALTSPWTTCSAPTLAAFQTCLGDLGTTAGKVSNMMLVLEPKQYAPAAYIAIPTGVNLEITGSGSAAVTGQVPAWNENPNAIVGSPTLNGVNEPPAGSDQDFFTVPATSNVIFKGVNFEGGSTAGWATIRDNGNVELDNVDFISNSGTDLAADDDPTLATPATAVVNNSNLSYGLGDAIETDSDSFVSLNNDTIVGNGLGGVSGNADIVNTLLAKNNSSGDGLFDCQPGFNITASHSIDDDGTCVTAVGGPGNGVTTDSDSSLDLVGQSTFHGGPTDTIELGSTSAAIGQATNCAPTDQRFYVRPSTTTCDVGSYQTGATDDSSVPVCPEPGNSAVVVSTNGSGVKQEAVTVSPTLAGAGFGPDSVTGYTLANTGGFTPGSVSWNTVTGNPFSGATSWDETSPTAAEPDFDTLASFTVTATKFSSADNVAGDTNWSFPLTDWAGQTTTCS